MRSAKQQNFSPVTTRQVSQPQARLSTWGRMLVAGCIIGSLFAPTALEAGGKEGLEKMKTEKPGVTRLAKANSNSRSKKKKKPKLITASRWVTIPNSNCHPCKLVLRTRDDWDYVETGVDFTPKNNKDRIEFGRFTLSDMGVSNLVNRVLTLGPYGWAMTGVDRADSLYNHMIVKGYAGPEDITACVVAVAGLRADEYSNCSVETKPLFDGRNFVWLQLKNGRPIGRMKLTPSCETLESLKDMAEDSNGCPIDGKRASIK